jgi:hypothetical protein
MKILLTGAPGSNPALHVLGVVKPLIMGGQCTSAKNNFSRLYFLDHRTDTRIEILNYVTDAEIEKAHDASYKISDCQYSIVLGIVEDLIVDKRDSAHIVLYFNLDSMNFQWPHELHELLDKVTDLSQHRPIDVVCLSTRRVFDSKTLGYFDQIHMFHNASPTNLDSIMGYLKDTDQYSDPDHLEILVSNLNPDSEDWIGLNALVEIEEGLKIDTYGRIVVNYDR